MSEPTPLLDFFRRGDVPRDVRLLAAEGTLAPRAQEQIAILVLLKDDADGEIRQATLQTIDRIPRDALTTCLARSDVPTEVREFFAARGVLPAEIPAINLDEPLIDAGPQEELDQPSDAGEPTEDGRETALERLARMGIHDRLKAAMKGSREMRAALIRDPNKMIAAAVLSSPKLSEPEVEAFSRMANVSDEVLRIIASDNRPHRH